MNQLLKKIARPVYRQAYRLYRRAVTWRPHKNPTELHAFWRQPDAGNLPSDYLAEGHERSAFLVNLLLRHADRNHSILEIGCNVGRNLEHLRRAGFRSLTGIEINGSALALLRQHFPDLATTATLHEGTAESLLPTLGEHDIVFTMAVLEHIHDEGAHTVVFPHIARIARKLIVTIEDEHGVSWRHFARNYRKVFAPLKWREVESIRMPPGCPEGFVGRVFVRES